MRTHSWTVLSFTGVIETDTIEGTERSASAAEESHNVSELQPCEGKVALLTLRRRSWQLRVEDRVVPMQPVDEHRTHERNVRRDKKPLAERESGMEAAADDRCVSAGAAVRHGRDS